MTERMHFGSHHAKPLRRDFSWDEDEFDPEPWRDRLSQQERARASQYVQAGLDASKGSGIARRYDGARKPQDDYRRSYKTMTTWDASYYVPSER